MTLNLNKICLNRIRLSAFLTVCCVASLCCGQATGQVTGTAVVPPLVKFTGTLSNANGKPMTGVVGVSFFLYKDAEGGAPVWMETQNIQVDRLGNYSVMLGSTTSRGLPADLFVSGEAVAHSPDAQRSITHR